MTLALERAEVTRGGRRVLGPVDCVLRPGEVVAIVGSNGAGKSTLLRALAGLQTLGAGEVRLDGAALTRPDGRAVGYLPQGAASHWNLRVDALAGLGRLPWGDGAAPAGRAAVADALARTGLSGFAARPVGTLSGGEAARAHFARVLAGQPRFILADEPLAQLDPGHALDMAGLLRAEAARGVGVMVVLHDLALAGGLADRMLWLADGTVVADGPPRTTLTAETIARVFGVAARVWWQETGVSVTVTGRA